MNCQQAEKLLHALQDGELDANASMQVEEHVANCPRCAAASRGLAKLSASIRTDTLRYKAPAALAQRLQAAAAQVAKTEQSVVPGRGWLRHPAWAAMAAMAIALAALEFFAAKKGGGDPMLAEVMSGHVRSLMANHLMDVESTNQHTVKPWFAGKLDFAPPVKDLREDGFPLLGGRLDFLDGRPAAALVYGRQKHVINLFIAPAESAPAATPGASESKGYHIVHWSASGMDCWAVSDLNQTELTEFAKLWLER